MMIEEEILKLMPADVPSGIGDIPGSTENTARILLYDGPGNTEFFASRTCSTMYNPLIRIIVRNKSYDMGKQWVEKIHEALHRYQDEHFMSIVISGNPQYLGKSIQKLHEFQILFLAQVL